MYGLSVHVPALFSLLVPCCLQTENNRPTTVDALTQNCRTLECTTDNPSSKTRQSSTTPSDGSCLDREHVAPRVNYSYARGVRMNNGRPHRSTKRGGAQQFRALT